MKLKTFSITISIYSPERFVFIKKTIEKLCYQITKNPNIKQTFKELIIVLDPSISSFHKEITDFSNKFNDIKIIVIIAKSSGLSAARNAALEIANTDYLVFLDDDAIPHKYYLQSISKIINITPAPPLMIAGRIVPVLISGNKLLPSDLYWIWGCTYEPVFSKKKGHFVRNPIGANMIFHTSALKKVGGFNNLLGRYRNQLLSAEETLTSYLISAKFNQRAWYFPDIIVFHFVPSSRNKITYIIKRAFFEGKSKRKFKKIITSVNRYRSYSNSLKIEQSYLKFLIKQNFRFEPIKFKLIRIIVMISTLIGFFI